MAKKHRAFFICSGFRPSAQCVAMPDSVHSAGLTCYVEAELFSRACCCPHLSMFRIARPCHETTWRFVGGIVLGPVLKSSYWIHVLLDSCPSGFSELWTADQVGHVAVQLHLRSG